MHHTSKSMAFIQNLENLNIVSTLLCKFHKVKKESFISLFLFGAKSEETLCMLKMMHLPFHKSMAHTGNNK